MKRFHPTPWLMLAGLGFSGLAQAQSSVTLFGIVDAGYESVRTASGRVSGLAPSGNSASRLGFRGTEDLGGGLSASFWLEAALAINSGISNSGTSPNNQNGVASNVAGGGLTFGRRATLSLNSAAGELRLGRDYVPTFWNLAVFDPFGVAGVGTLIATYAALGASGGGSGATSVRSSNSISYFLPANLGGLYGQASYAFGNNADTASATAYGSSSVNIKDNGNYAGARVGYAAGPVNVAAAHGRRSYQAGTNSTANLLGMPITGGNYTDTNLGGSYDFGVLKLMGTVTRQQVADVGSPGNTASIKGWSLAFNAPVGAGNWIAQYGVVKVGGARADKWAVGYVYNLSKRTALYTTWAHVGNQGGASMTAGSFSGGSLVPAGTASSNANGSSSGFDLGIRTTF